MKEKVEEIIEEIIEERVDDIVGSPYIYFNRAMFTLTNPSSSGTITWALSPGAPFTLSNTTGATTYVSKTANSSGSGTLAAFINGFPVATLYITSYAVAIAGPSTVNSGSANNNYELPNVSGASYNWQGVNMTPASSISNYRMYFTASSSQSSGMVECFVTLNGVSNFFDRFISIQ